MNLREIIDGWKAEGRISADDHRTAVSLLADAQDARQDWRDDPSADERWNAGCDFAMEHLCRVLGVDTADVNWDAATETVDGDVMAVIGNILRAKFGEDWGPDAAVAWRTPMVSKDHYQLTSYADVAEQWRNSGIPVEPLYAAPPALTEGHPAWDGEPTDAQVNSACLSYRHDFGLLDASEQQIMKWKAREWLRVWRKEGFGCDRDEVIERCAGVVDKCNREGPYIAIGAAPRIRALKNPSQHPSTNRGSAA